MSSFASLGNVPLDEHEARAFLERRLRMGALVLACFWGVSWALGVAYVAVTSPSRTLAIVRGAPSWTEIATFALLACAWLWLRRASPSLRALERAEAALTIAQGVALGVLLLPRAPGLEEEVTAVFGVEVVLALRAALVPSTPWRTAIVGVLACIPSALAWLPRDGRPNAFYATMTGAIVGVTVWLVASVGATVVVSSVVYGLTRRIREAMKLGQYTLEQRIGKGGMGVVYRARHALLRRPTAIKLLPDASAEAVARFEREAQRTAELASPHVVAVYDFGRTAEGVFYYAMEYLEGLDLETIVRDDGPQPPARVLHVVRQIAEALSEAHEAGLVHRDVKPANVMLTQRARAHDHAKLLDFGLVHEIDAGKSDVPRGTPLYMAPETFGGVEVDDRADLYALGATAYALLAGKPPFEGATLLELAEMHARTPPAPPSMRLGRELPRSLERVIMTCLAKDPSERPATAEELLEMLDACDDVPRWTAEDARAWWTSRAPALHPTREAPERATVGVARRDAIL